MRLFAKSVALVLGILLGAFPVLAAIPCAASSCATEQNAECCMGMSMDDAAMIAPAAQMLTQAPVNSSAPLCECAASTEASTPSVTQETQGLLDLATTVADWTLLDLATRAPEGYRTPPLRAFSRPAQSVLCTFLI